MEIVRKRKVRSDKKKELKPTINYRLHDCVYRLSYITNTPVKDVGVEICKSGLSSRKVIELLSKKFRRNYKFKQTVYIGDLERESNRVKTLEGLKKRITLRFDQNDSEQICELAYALDVTPTTAAAILLDAAVKNTDIVNVYLKQYVEETLDEARMRELKEVLKFINKNNPYDEEISLTMLISYLFDEFMDSTMNFKKVITNWLDKYK